MLTGKSLPFNLFKATKKNFGANEKVLKARIKSVSSIAKITKAMKMVSSSKMRADLVRLEGGKDSADARYLKIFLGELVKYIYIKDDER